MKSPAGTPLVSAIIVTLNRMEDVAEAIESLRRQTYDNTEIVVVDNGSHDGTPGMIKERYSEVHLVGLGCNTGAYHGRNVGVDASKGEIVFFLDDDATLEEGSIAAIVERFSKENNLGVIVCELVSSGSRILNMVPHHGGGTDEREFYLGDMVLEGATAMRKDAFQAVGGWPAHYFRQYVGKDLSYRMIDAGYNILYLSTATVFHKESPLGDLSRKQIEKQKIFYKTRNHLWITWKYLPPLRAVLESIIRIVDQFGEALRMGAIGLYLRGLAAAAVSMPRVVLKERRPVNRRTLAQIDYMAYGGMVTQAEMLESLPAINFRTLLWKKFFTLLSRGRHRTSSVEQR